MNLISAGLALTAVLAIAFGVAGYLTRPGPDVVAAEAARGIAELEQLLDLESRS